MYHPAVGDSVLRRMAYPMQYPVHHGGHGQRISTPCAHVHSTVWQWSEYVMPQHGDTMGIQSGVLSRNGTWDLMLTRYPSWSGHNP